MILYVFDQYRGNKTSERNTEQLVTLALKQYVEEKNLINTISNNTLIGKETCPAFGAGIMFANYSGWTIKVKAIVQHNIIKDNLAISQNKHSVGAGVMFQLVTGIFTDNEVTGNQATAATSFWAVGGFYCLGLKNGSLINNNIFRENSSTMFGGIHIDPFDLNPQTILVENNYFIDNMAQKGGAFSTYDNPVKLQNNIFSGNHSEQGGAVYLERASNTTVHLATLVNNSFSRNTATYGGAIASLDAKPLIFNSVFWGDNAGYGRELNLFGTEQVEIANTNIEHAFFNGK